jgi:hypothetical protein
MMDSKAKRNHTHSERSSGGSKGSNHLPDLKPPITSNSRFDQKGIPDDKRQIITNFNNAKGGANS